MIKTPKNARVHSLSSETTRSQGKDANMISRGNSRVIPHTHVITGSLMRTQYWQRFCHAESKDFIWKQNLCEYCLESNHVARSCIRPGVCLLSGCGERHHSLLHPPSSSITPMDLGASGRTKTTSDQVSTGFKETNKASPTVTPHHIKAREDCTALVLFAMYWSSDPLIGNTGIQNIVTKNTFDELRQYLHFSNSETEPQPGKENFDCLYKVR